MHKNTKSSNLKFGGMILENILHILEKNLCAESALKTKKNNLNFLNTLSIIPWSTSVYAVAYEPHNTLQLFWNIENSNIEHACIIYARMHTYYGIIRSSTSNTKCTKLFVYNTSAITSASTSRLWINRWFHFRLESPPRAADATTKLTHSTAIAFTAREWLG